MLRLLVWFKTYARYFAAGWLIIIIVVSSMPGVPLLEIHTQKTNIRLDYLFHFGEYGVLAFLTYLSFAGDDFKMSYKKLLLIAAVLIIIAILDEVHQKFIPGRSYNIKDILSNISGIVAILLFSVLIFGKMEPPRNQVE
jgi:VanZ family protein